jgi:hypothetical protein
LDFGARVKSAAGGYVGERSNSTPDGKISARQVMVAVKAGSQVLLNVLVVVKISFMVLPKVREKSD